MLKSRDAAFEGRVTNECAVPETLPDVPPQKFDVARPLEAPITARGTLTSLLQPGTLGLSKRRTAPVTPQPRTESVALRQDPAFRAKAKPIWRYKNHTKERT